MACINAVSFHEERSLEAICRRVRAAGFDALELSRPPFYEKLTTPGLRQRFRVWAEGLGLTLYGFDCWVDVDPYTRREETLAEFRRALDWAADLSLGMVISHDSWTSVNGHRSPAACLASNTKLFREVVALAVARGLRVVLEPHPDTLSMQASWAIELIDSVGEGFPPGSIGILYDCCHYGVGQPASYIKAIRTLGHRITHVHLSDGDAETYALHLPLGDGVLALVEIVDTLCEVGYRGTLTNDLYNYPLLDDGARRNVARVREIEARWPAAPPRGTR
jgi:sugar phosphate isomerase/epimerase